MAASQLIAQILGPLYLTATLGWLMNRDFYRNMITGFASNHAVLYMGGVMAFLFGAVVLRFNNIWTADWRVLITLLGWAGLIKGLTILVFPQTMIRFSHTLVHNNIALFIGFGFAFLAGAALTWFGYFA